MFERKILFVVTEIESLRHWHPWHAHKIKKIINDNENTLTHRDCVRVIKTSNWSMENWLYDQKFKVSTHVNVKLLLHTNQQCSFFLLLYFRWFDLSMCMCFAWCSAMWFMHSKCIWNDESIFNWCFESNCCIFWFWFAIRLTSFICFVPNWC